MGPYHPAMMEGPGADRATVGRMLARRLVARRPFSITGIVIVVFLAVLGVAVFAAVYRPFAVALAGAAALVTLTWLLDRRASGRR